MHRIISHPSVDLLSSPENAVSIAREQREAKDVSLMICDEQILPPYVVPRATFEVKCHRRHVAIDAAYCSIANTEGRALIFHRFEIMMAEVVLHDVYHVVEGGRDQMRRARSCIHEATAGPVMPTLESSVRESQPPTVQANVLQTDEVMAFIVEIR